MLKSYPDILYVRMLAREQYVDNSPHSVANCCLKIHNAHLKISRQFLDKVLSNFLLCRDFFHSNFELNRSNVSGSQEQTVCQIKCCVENNSHPVILKTIFDHRAI